MKSNRLASWVLALVLAAAAATAAAGPTDTPAPVIAGEPTRVIFIVPGVTKNNSIETVWFCTSLERSDAIYIGVEVFSSDGGPPLNDVAAGDGVAVVQPGGGVTIATGAIAGFHENVVTEGVAAPLRSGSARIVSTSKRIACDAALMDEVETPPTTIGSLRVYSPRNHDD